MRVEGLTLWDETDLYENKHTKDYGYLGEGYGFFTGDALSFCSECSDSEELNEVIDFLQSEDAGYILKSQQSLQNYCDSHLHDHIPYHFNCECWAFRVMTESNVWYLFCTPWNERKAFFLHGFVREPLFAAFSAERGLPESCVGVLPFSGERIRIRFGDGELERFPQFGANMEENKIWADEQNKTRKITIEQQRAMENGAVYGWEKPVALPQNYDKDGFYSPGEEMTKTTWTQRLKK